MAQAKSNGPARRKNRVSPSATASFSLACAVPAASFIPDDLPALRHWLADRPDADELFELPIREVVVRSNAIARLPGVLADLEAPARVLLVQDDRPYTRAEVDLKPLVRDLLAGSRRQVEVLTLPRGPDGLVHADLENVERGRAAIGGRPTAVVALGSGVVQSVDVVVGQHVAAGHVVVTIRPAGPGAGVVPPRSGADDAHGRANDFRAAGRVDRGQ